MKNILIIITITSILGITLLAPAYAEKPQKLYAVIFGISIGEKGELLNVRIAKTTDVYSKSTEAVKMEIPKIYFEKAKEKIRSHGYEPSFENGKPKEFFTYFYFDPGRPELLIDDLKMIE